MRRVFRFAPFLLLVVLWGCGRNSVTPSGAPVINTFTASPATVAASGTPVQLSWTISGTATSLSIDSGVGPVSGSSRTVNPTATTTYTLTASNSSGDATKSVTVTVGGGGGGGGEPTGTFGGSLSQTGPFLNDSGGISDPNDTRIVRAQPNTTIYFQASYTDTDGITSVVPYLANNRVNTDLTPGTAVLGFTSAGPTGCTPDGTQQAVTCTFAISVGNIPNITALPEFAGEFAYVFKVNVTDSTGTVTTNSTRAYVTVGVTGGTPDPTTTDPTDPTDPTTPDPTDPTTPDPTDPDPTNPDPTTPTPTTYALTVSKAGSGTGTVTGSGINCGSDCSGSYNSGTSVTLTAAAATGSTFAGWSGACSGTGTCSVTMNAAKAVTATFNGTTPAFTVSVEDVSDLTLGATGTVATTLNANVSNAPAGTTYKWTASGANASSVSFSPDTSEDTGATFSAAGTYSLTLTATGGSQTKSDSISVTVNPAATDATPPSVTIDQASTQSDPAASLPIAYTAVFNEPVTGFTDSDVTLSGTSPGTTATVSGGPTTYTISVSGATTDGTVIVNIAAGAATDAAGNSSTASTSTDNTVTYNAP